MKVVYVLFIIIEEQHTINKEIAVSTFVVCLYFQGWSECNNVKAF